VDLIPRSPTRADTRHRFVVTGQVPVDIVRLDIYPDGGLARLRAVGIPTPPGRAALFARWFDRLSETQAGATVRSFLAADRSWADLLVAARPLTDAAGVAAGLARAAAGAPSPDAQRIRGLLG
jgi:allantoicase